MLRKWNFLTRNYVYAIAELRPALKQRGGTLQQPVERPIISGIQGKVGSALMLLLLKSRLVALPLEVQSSSSLAGRFTLAATLHFLRGKIYLFVGSVKELRNYAYTSAELGQRRRNESGF